MTAAVEPLLWVDICPPAELAPGRGVAALVNGEQVALFMVGDEVFAVSNYDPFSHAFVISRGIVGSKGHTVKVASPMYKHSFDLRSGACIDDPTTFLATYAARVADGRVQVATP